MIMFTGRCGGTFLQRSLDLHSGISCGEELLSTYKLDSDRQIEFMNEFYGGGGDVACGFKNKLEFISDQDVFLRYLHDNDIKIIHLYRNNMIKQALSCYTANILRTKHGVYHLYPEDDEKVIKSIELNMNHFTECLMWVIEQDRRMFKFLCNYQNIMRLSYENLNKEPDVAIRRSQEFIGVEYEEVMDSMLKINPDNISEMIDNYDEFVDRLVHLTSNCGAFDDRVLFDGMF
jgi:hypothetical protein